jgi:hypothetical protein
MVKSTGVLPVSKQSVAFSLGMKDNRCGKAFDGDKGYNPTTRLLGAIGRTGARKI